MNIMLEELLKLPKRFKELIAQNSLCDDKSLTLKID